MKKGSLTGRVKMMMTMMVMLVMMLGKASLRFIHINQIECKEEVASVNVCMFIKVIIAFSFKEVKTNTLLFSLLSN